VGAVVIGFGNEDAGEAVEIAVVGEGGVREFLDSGDAVLFEHHDEHFRVHDGAGVEELHQTTKAQVKTGGKLQSGMTNDGNLTRLRGGPLRRGK